MSSYRKAERKNLEPSVSTPVSFAENATDTLFKKRRISGNVQNVPSIQSILTL